MNKPIRLEQTAAAREELLTLDSIAAIGFYSELPRFPDQIGQYSLIFGTDTIPFFAHKLLVDAEFLDCFTFSLQAGQNFSSDSVQDTPLCLVNLALAKQLLPSSSSTLKQNGHSLLGKMIIPNPDRDSTGTICGLFEGDLHSLMLDQQQAEKWRALPLILTPGHTFTEMAINVKGGDIKDLNQSIIQKMQQLGYMVQ